MCSSCLTSVANAVEVHWKFLLYNRTHLFSQMTPVLSFFIHLHDFAANSNAKSYFTSYLTHMEIHYILTHNVDVAYNKLVLHVSDVTL